jgi:hypothetical protein
MSEPVIVEVVIAAPADAVWRALREPAEIRRWFGWEYDEQGGLPSEIELIFHQESTASEPDLTLDTGGGTFVLEPQGDRTVVRITRAAPAGQSGWEGIYDEVNEGWLTFVQQLRFYLERHPGQDRRTQLVEAAGEGEEWFTAPNQHGVVLEDGSLAVTTRERVIVSAYG